MTRFSGEVRSIGLLLATLDELLKHRHDFRDMSLVNRDELDDVERARDIVRAELLERAGR